MAVDALMRKLNIPSKFIPYLEKHRIYELFYDLGNELAMSQPEDPLIFMKECLERMVQVRDKRLVIIIASSNLDRIKLAQLISMKTGYGMLSRYIMCGKSGNHLDPVTLAVNTADHIRSSDKEGWLFVDYPRNKQEAKMLIKHKVIPTHTFLLLDEDKTTQNEDNNSHESIEDNYFPSDCDTNILELREMFKSSLNVISVKGKSFEEIASLCAQLTAKMKPRHASTLFRVALIGPKGSRRKTLAKLLQNKYNLVHVDIFHLIHAARQLDDELGEEIKQLDKFKLPYSNKLILNLLKSRLYSKDCLERGYVLTNYPRSREDFVLLDSIKTPPNKVIFVDIDSAVCKNRLEDRVINMYTGQLYSKKLIHDNELLMSQTLVHPDDDLCVIEEEIKFYNRHVSDLMDYCGKTGFVINGEGSIKILFERVESVLMSPAPTVTPRSGKMGVSRHSMHEHIAQTLNVANSYPFQDSQQVVPLIDSEELIHRFKELKRNLSQPKVLEDPKRYSNTSRDSDVIIKPQEKNQNDNSADTLRAQLGISDEYIFSSVGHGVHGEDNSGASYESFYFDNDDYCTCEEELQLVDDSICTCDESLFLDEDYCTCEEPLFLD